VGRFLFMLLFVFLFISNVHAAPSEPLDCTKLRTSQFVVNGRTYTKYHVVNPKFLSCVPVQPMATWTVNKTEWNEDDENGFSEFVKAIGNSGCRTTDDCMKSDKNPLRDEMDLISVHYSDCADFPYYLRAYYAYKKHLPMSMTSVFSPIPLTPEQQILQNIAIEKATAESPKALSDLLAHIKDDRYSVNGNSVVRKYQIPSTKGDVKNFFAVAAIIRDQVSSGTLRILKSMDGKPQPDFYSPQITIEFIKPGTVLYNPAGHVAIVYDVTPEGFIKFIDAHPDNSVSHKVFDQDFAVYKKEYAGNFKNWRPVKLENVKMDTENTIVSATVVQPKDEEISGYSMEQYTGHAPGSSKPIFVFDGMNSKSLDFQIFVKLRLSGGKYRIQPESEMLGLMTHLCNDVQNRINAINLAIADSIDDKPHPDNLPVNIYGASGEWESYSTPGSDNRLRNKILTIATIAKGWMDLAKAKSPLLDFKGEDLKAVLIKKYYDGIYQCPMKYINSENEPVLMGLNTVIERLTRISYDPYDCIERRWGAFSEAELRSCKESQSDKEWYMNQQYLRNQVKKDIKAVHGFTLEQLKTMAQLGQINNQVDDSKFDLLKLLQELK
jgi:hypothetical protein